MLVLFISLKHLEMYTIVNCKSRNELDNVVFSVQLLFLMINTRKLKLASIFQRENMRLWWKGSTFTYQTCFFPPTNKYTCLLTFYRFQRSTFWRVCYHWFHFALYFPACDVPLLISLLPLSQQTWVCFCRIIFFMRNISFWFKRFSGT